jgi:GTPase SAR1 family protein
MNNAINEGYSLFGERKDRLVDCIERAHDQFIALSMSSKTQIATDLKVRLQSNQFRVIVIGEFKRGKSTFINALLHQEVLPAFATPCTAVINEIKWGEDRSAILHFREELPDQLPTGLPSPVVEHLKQAGGSEVPPLTIPIEDLEDYVVIADPTKDQAASVAESPYRCVEIFWPLELCRNGVEVVDSPGLNEHGTRTRVTIEYLAHVDAVLFVMSCQALAGLEELKVVENQIHRAGHKEIFFIANRFDEIRPKERDRVIQYGRAKLGPKTELGEAGVFFISALDALDGRLDGNEGQIKQSGILELELSLARFLTADRGRVKLLRPARELFTSLREAKSEVIPQQLAMLGLDQKELQSRYDQVKPGLEDAEQRRRQIIDKVNRHREKLKIDIKNLGIAKLREISDEVTLWGESYETKTEFSVLRLTSKPQIEAIIKEVSEHLSKKIEEKLTKWQTDCLEPRLVEWMQDLEISIGGQVEDFLSHLNKVSTTLSGIGSGTSINQSKEEISPMERILSAAGGFLIGGAGSAVVGGTMGFKEMLKSLGPQIALIVVAIVAGITNPFILIPLMLGGSAVQGFLKQGAVTNKIKMGVAKELSVKLRSESHEQGEKMANEVFSQTADVVNTIDAGLEAEIKTRREQVETALKELQQGEASVAARRSELQKLSSQVDSIQSDVTELLFELAG